MKSEHPFLFNWLRQIFPPHIVSAEFTEEKKATQPPLIIKLSAGEDDKIFVLKPQTAPETTQQDENKVNN